MKIVLDKLYLKYILYIVLTATILYILYGVIANIGTILNGLLAFLQSVLSVLSPVIIALVIAYLLRPAVGWAEHRLKLPRIFSVLLTYVLVLGIIIAFVYSIYAMIGGQITQNLHLDSMVDSIISYLQKYNDIYQNLVTKLEASGLSVEVKNQFLNILNASKDYIGTAFAGIFTSIKNLGGNIINVLLGFIIAFYLLKDEKYFKNIFVEACQTIFKERKSLAIMSFLHDINRVVSRFIRGQLLDGLLVGILSSIALLILGIDFAVLIGMTAGFFNIIPYFGPIIGTIPAVIIGLLSGSPIKALFAVIALLLVQQIDSTVISPKIVGDSVGLHPVFVILSVVIGGSYFGLFGMLLAVPVAGILKLIFGRLMLRLRDKQAQEL